MSNSAKRKSANGIDNLAESDDETIIYGNDYSSDECDNLSSDEFSSDSDATDSDSDLLDDVRVWCPVDTDRPLAAPPRFPFTGQPGIQVPIADNNDPLAYLRLFLTDDIVDVIVAETNRYAEQTLSRTPHRRWSRTRNWTSVTNEDIWLFFGVLFLQGIVHKPQQQWYWSKNRLLETPIFSRVMSEYRFSLIMKFLHFVNNDTFDATSHPPQSSRKSMKYIRRCC